MLGEAHKALVVWLCRRMASDGFHLLASDTQSRPCSSRDLRVSPLIGGIRPDAIAMKGANALLAFGEAKTSGDISNQHTLKQLSRMLAFRDAHGRNAHVYLAFPRSARPLALRTILKLGLRDAVRVRTIAIPDSLLRAA